MGNFIDLTEKRFGRLVVLEMKGKNNNGAILWKCLCDCGKEHIVVGAKLKNGWTKSCGCFRIDFARESFLKHGGRRLPEYVAWSQMKGRCLNKNNLGYKDYGGRGIIVCERWINSFENFLFDVGRRPTSKHSIDRIKVEGNYEPGNVRWGTTMQQGGNKRNNRWLEFRGERMILSDWARELNVDHKTLSYVIEKRGNDSGFEYIINRKK